MRCNEIAAAIHKRMCEDDRFGYDWDERWGYYWNVWNIGGHDYVVYAGDYDCSSSCITAWKKAIEGTAYEGALDGATYTGNMRSVFVGSGLFEWKPMSFLADTGDLYLNEGSHVAMCQTQYPDVLSEFSINEHGDVYGGERGDQTGWESHVSDYYDFPWDGILHYNGKADSSAPKPPKPSTDAVVYRVSSDPSGQYWYDEMHDHYDTGGSGDTYAGEYGEAIRWVAVKSCRYRVYTRLSGWLPWVDEYNIHDLDYGCAGDGSLITGIEIDDSTIRHAAHILGKSWYPDMIGRKDTGGSNDTFAGDLANPIDAIRMCRA